jgi:hypothetical protein
MSALRRQAGLTTGSEARRSNGRRVCWGFVVSPLFLKENPSVRRPFATIDGAPFIFPRQSGNRRRRLSGIHVRQTLTAKLDPEFRALLK